jgi:hypothetical protein
MNNAITVHLVALLAGLPVFTAHAEAPPAPVKADRVHPDPRAGYLVS